MKNEKKLNKEESIEDKELSDKELDLVSGGFGGTLFAVEAAQVGAELPGTPTEKVFNSLALGGVAGLMSPVADPLLDAATIIDTISGTNLNPFSKKK